jgi:hypothetical protein
VILESDGFATLMVIVGFTWVKEVAFTLEIVGAAGGGAAGGGAVGNISGNNKTFDIFIPSEFNIGVNEVLFAVFPVPN